MEAIIKVENLYKIYKIYKKPLDRLRSLLMKDAPSELYTALDNISFTVRKGETVGIIGENGAGKSTLLKILSGVLSPTRGRVDVNTLALSILELGVGFHPEFTGRENLFFYGDVLGFGRDFLKGKVDEIIEFSELDSFIDKPIKTYSSGMLMRLAFSVVSSFDPEILILDEVLAVGDMYFQKKSLNRILEYKKKGKTMLYCAHDTYHIRMLCDRVIWLKNGRAEMIGDTESVVAEYESYQLSKSGPEQISGMSDKGSPVIIRSFKMTSSMPMRRGDDMTFEIITEGRDDIIYNVSISIKLKEGRGVFFTGTHLNGGSPLSGSMRIKVVFPDNKLLSGFFYAHVRIWDEHGLILYAERVTPSFEIKNETKELGFMYMENVIKIEQAHF